MTDEFKWFRNRLTGKVAQFPARFGERPLLEEIPSEDASCIDCALPDVDHDHETETGEITFSQYDPDETDDLLVDDNDGEDA